jgi:hypothetical protein
VTRFDKAQLVAFLRAVDHNLRERIKVVVIGGAAAAIGYDSRVRTSDIDVFNVLEGSVEALVEAADRARRQTGFAVSVGTAAVADLPYNHETRLRRVRGLSLEQLTVIVPEKYDLALSKIVRGYPHDIDAIESMSERHHLARQTLVRRFETELMKEAIGDPKELALNMAIVAGRLYGFDEARKLAERWGVPIPRRR